MTARTTVVVPVRNLLSITRQCVEALVSGYLDRQDVDVVVVDDGSTDGTYEFLKTAAGVGVVRHAESAGFAKSCNAGAAAGSGEYVLFLNNDTQGADGWLDALVSYAEANEQAAIVGARLLYGNGTIQHAGIVFGADLLPRHVYRGFPGYHPAVTKPRRLQAVTAACMLVRRSAFEAIGGFDTSFLNGFDDVDLCFRVAESGGETHYCPDSVLVHLEAATRGEDAKLFRRNAARYLERWADRVRRDDLETYVEDGLLELVPGDLYPLELRVDPRLATIDQGDVYDVLEERSRQAFDLIKENAALRTRLDEASDWARSSLADDEQPMSKPERTR
jgi:GT2 family glycosyltransferase